MDVATKRCRGRRFKKEAERVHRCDGFGSKPRIRPHHRLRVSNPKFDAMIALVRIDAIGSDVNVVGSKTAFGSERVIDDVAVVEHEPSRRLRLDVSALEMC